MQEIILRIVFTSLIQTGTLSYLQLNPTLRNENITSRKKIKNSVNNIFIQENYNDFYYTSYNYLRNVPNKYVRFKIEKNGIIIDTNLFKNYTEESYFDLDLFH